MTADFRKNSRLFSDMMFPGTWAEKTDLPT
jgi:hypothetical protein